MPAAKNWLPGLMSKGKKKRGSKSGEKRGDRLLTCGTVYLVKSLG
jgi:hypothetical protein